MNWISIFRPGPKAIFLLCMPALLLAGCAGTEPYAHRALAPGTGWSRAPDLSVYAAMDMAGDIAREQEVLCAGRNPAEVEQGWRAEFGARRDWIVGTLVQRYGAEAVGRAHRRVGPREPCPSVANNKWRLHYARMLRLLELRLYPRDYWSN